jgi:DNA-binding beta-propeller fold protein YncE
LHSDRQSAVVISSHRRTPGARRLLSFLAAGAGCFALAGCGSQYRPVVSSINPVGPAAQPTKYAVAISVPSATAPGLVTLVDVSGDTILDTTALGVNPYYLVLDTGGTTGYTLNGDGTLTSFPLSTSLIASNVAETTLLPATNGTTELPVSLTPQGTYIYLAEPGRNALAELQVQGTSPAVKQELPTGANTIYTVSATNAPRVYSISSGTAGGPGYVSGIETTTNTISNTIPVGVNPVYGVMTSDARRAFILNQGSNTVSVVNAQTNALDTFTVNGVVTGTIPVGVGPVWADFAPTLSEMLVVNQGSGTAAGSVSVVNIPFCSQTTVVTNPNCDPANPVDAVGFGQVLATIPVGINPIMISVLQDGTKAYVANQGNASQGIAGSVSVINLLNDTVEATIAGGVSSNANDQLVHGHPNYIAGTTGTPTGKVYVTAPDSNDLTILRTDVDTVETHLPLQGAGVSVRVNRQ